MEPARGEETQQLAGAVMETWMIVLIVAAAIVVIWLLTRKKTVSTEVAPRALVNTISMQPDTAPGVVPSTGQPPPAPPPAPPPNVPVASYSAARAQNVLRTAISPSAVISHIPVVGSQLAAPGKAIGSAVSKITALF
jgi:hypothetical protein